MRLVALSLFVLGIWVAGAWGEPAAAVPATQPTTTAADSPAIDVLVLPFAPLTDQKLPADWGRAVQKNLIADLGQAHFHPGEGSDASDAQSARQMGEARYIISGTYQTADGLLRFDGQITDARSNTVAGGLKATGAARDLFALEDAISSQAIRQLHRLMNPAADTKGPENPLTRAGIVENPVPGMKTYEGSALQQYVDSNRTPSTDFSDQVRRSSDQQTYNYGSGGADWASGGGLGYPFGGINYFGGYGGFAYGYTTPFVSITGHVGRPIYFGRDNSQRP